jgi:hypothetical protein
MDDDELKGLPIGCSWSQTSRFKYLLKLFFLYWLWAISPSAIALPDNFN